MSQLKIGDTIIVKHFQPTGREIELSYKGVKGILSYDEMPRELNDLSKAKRGLGDELCVKVTSIKKRGDEGYFVAKYIKPGRTRKEDFFSTTVTGDKFLGTVVGIEPYGIFVNLEKGIDGLLHNSNSSISPNQVNIGDEIEVEIFNLNRANKRISLKTLGHMKMTSSSRNRKRKGELLQEKLAKQGYIEKFYDYGNYKYEDFMHQTVAANDQYGIFQN